MSDKPDRIHHLDLCPRCQGLRATRLERIDGITSIHIEAGTHILSGSFTLGGPVEMYVGPVVEECPQQPLSDETP